MDHRTMKLMSMHKALHTRDDIDRQETKKEEIWPALRIVWMQWFKDSKNIQKVTDKGKRAK